MKPTPYQLLDLIRRLPNWVYHITICPIENKPSVTNEWLDGGIDGKSFEGDTIEEAAQKLINYINKHKGRKSATGRAVDKSGWPDLEKVFEYCRQKLDND